MIQNKCDEGTDGVRDDLDRIDLRAYLTVGLELPGLVGERSGLPGRGGEPVCRRHVNVFNAQKLYFFLSFKMRQHPYDRPSLKPEA